MLIAKSKFAGLDVIIFSGWSQSRTPIYGLYLCGAGAHSGGGVTGAPGRNAAHQDLRDWKRGPLRRGRP